MKTEYSLTYAPSPDSELVAFPVGEAEWSGGKWPADLAKLDAELGGWVRELCARERFRGADDTSVVVQTHGKVGPQRIAVLGVGKLPASEGFAPAAREWSARAAKLACAAKLEGSTLVLDLPQGADPERALRFAYEGGELALYRFEKYRREQDRKPTTVTAIRVVLGGAGAALSAEYAARAERQAAATVRAIGYARDLVNETPNHTYPATLAEAARSAAVAAGLECTVYDGAAIRGMGMELLQAVNVGSQHEPRLVHITYRPPGDTSKLPHVALVGKGITFDSGGYSLKPMGAIDDMKIDMAGAAAVIGTMMALPAFAPRVVVHGIMPMAENLVSGAAYKLGDVYRGHNGKTVEIRNTDAEGRLILADALGYALKQNITEVTTLATLTGACVVALGPYTAGVFANTDALSRDYLAAAQAAGEDAWPLPMSRKLRSMLKSDVADMKNVGERWGGAITAALFLDEFVDGKPYIHVDLAGPAYIEKAIDAAVPKGGSGYGILTLLEYLERRGGQPA
jgi:leucyl aminopeptidase